jgi:hypothetical protein
VKLDFTGGPRGEAFVDVAKDASLRKFGCERLLAREIAFDNGRKPHEVAGAGAPFANDTKMIAAEGAGTNDREGDGWRGSGRHLN